MNDRRIFTLEDANAIIPALEIYFAQAMQLRAQLRATYGELESLGHAPTQAPLAADAPKDVQRLTARFQALLESLTETLHRIEDTGVAVKDVDLGLCDFLGERDGRTVWLCWQYGEKQIDYWHDLDTGFGGRRPLKDESIPGRLLH
jgi:hypothetical protein